MADDIPRKKTLGQRLMDTLTKSYTYSSGKATEPAAPPTESARSLNPRKDAEIDLAKDETGEGAQVQQKRKGGVVRARGVGCARKGHGKGTMR